MKYPLTERGLRLALWRERWRTALIAVFVFAAGFWFGWKFREARAAVDAAAINTARHDALRAAQCALLVAPLRPGLC